MSVLGGSDLANLKTKAERTPDGKAYVVNGHKVRISHICIAMD